MAVASLFTSGESNPSEGTLRAGSVERWAFTGPVIMSQRRNSHLSAALPDGRVVILGGHEIQDAFAEEVEIFDPNSSTFSSGGATVEVQRWFAAIGLQDGRVLLTGGIPDSRTGPPEPTTRAEIYDPATDTFQPTGSMTTGRARHTMALLGDGRVLVVGGMGGSGTTEVYDPDSGRFTAGPEFSGEGLLTQALALRDGSVLIVGGGTAERYDPASGTIEVVNDSGDLPDVPALLPDGRVLLTGGLDHDVWRATWPPRVSETGETTYPAIRIVDRAVILDPFTGEATEVEPMTSTRAFHRALTLPDGRVLIAGGIPDEAAQDGSDEIEAEDILRRSEIFDPATGRFTPAMEIPDLAFWFTMDLLPDGRVLVVGADEPWPLYAAHVFRP